MKPKSFEFGRVCLDVWTGPSVVKVAPNLAEHTPHLVEHAPNLAEFSPNQGGMARIWSSPEFGRTRPYWAEFTLNLVPPNLVKDTSDLVEHAPNFLVDARSSVTLPQILGWIEAIVRSARIYRCKAHLASRDLWPIACRSRTELSPPDVPEVEDGVLLPPGPRV